MVAKPPTGEFSYCRSFKPRPSPLQLNVSAHTQRGDYLNAESAFCVISETPATWPNSAPRPLLVVTMVIEVKKTRKLDELIAQGLVRPPRSTGKFIPKPIKLKDGATVSEFIDEQRR